MNSEAGCHVLLVCFPGQGHVNPMLRLGKKLASKGLLVTFSTSANFGRQMKKASNISDQPTPAGDGFIRFEFFDDGTGENGLEAMNIDEYVSEIERLGRPSLVQMINKNAEENRPVSCVIGNPFIPWVCDVADELGIPCAVFWVQSCASFAVYYHYFHNSVPYPSETDPKLDVQLPSLPVLKHDEIPSFLLPTEINGVLREAILGQFRNLSIPFCIFMDTFEELEPEIISYMSKLCPIKPVGPLFKNLENTVSGDYLRAEDCCIEWLNSKPPRSVAYVSFGSVVHLKQEQVDEIAYGLSESGFSFLWVLKPPNRISGLQRHVLPEGVVERAGDRAMVVQWSPQEKVLSHPSVGCFVTHCGWNSSVEATSLGVPVVAFPQWGDQVTNAKFLVDVFGVGLRLSRGATEDRLVPRGEIQKCLEEAMVGSKAEELRRNGLKWQKASEMAVADGGSSNRNIQDFIAEVGKHIPKRSIGPN